eukprot:CAMPEP_0176344210 /NCGR_PEP_ID=MMETSP0126-20121128/4529_1 /TAXON_ID=141414 ORGANISM="Strombidinopsis acuminatum, Strain SPMC142" /NCGR_SAMPLE_ID=MMETSP0126 /ASSEMBLY_ACC=CAM_ASM_000229 /LENGTH=59 /DNA_ID=CAMNT_0017690557 /DNA_START=1607 /DNA_END=1786 /DNA_ORIENTATION=+
MDTNFLVSQIPKPKANTGFQLVDDNDNDKEPEKPTAKEPAADNQEGDDYGEDEFEADDK